MRVDAGERLQRVLRVMPVLAARGEIPIEEMPSLAGVDAITLLDDLRGLTDREDEPGGFVEAISILVDTKSVSVTSPHFRRPTRITLPELCALELGLAMLAGSADQPERDAISRARGRVRQAIVATPKSAARDDLWYASGPDLADDQILSTLRGCAAEKAKADIVYRRGDSAESTARVVQPYAVLPVRGKWFLVAHCERASSVRFFRVDRVVSADRLDQAIDHELPDEVRGLLLDTNRALVSQASERLVVRYSPRIARWIAEREGGDLAADGSLTVSHPLADDAWAVRHVLQYGGEAEVLEPRRVRGKLAATLRNMSSAVGYD